MSSSSNFYDRTLGNLHNSFNRAPTATGARAPEAPRASFAASSFRFVPSHDASTGSLLSTLLPAEDTKGVKATAVVQKRKPMKKKEEGEEPLSRSSDNEGDLSFVDKDEDPKDPNPFLKRSHYSSSRDKKKRQRTLPPSSSESGGDESDDDDDDDDDDVDEEEAEKEDDPALFYRKDGKHLQYKADEFLDLSEEEFKERNARRLARGKPELKRPEAPSESDEGHLYQYRSPPPSDDSDSESVSPSSPPSTPELMGPVDLPLLDPMDVDEDEDEDEDEAHALLKDTSRFLQVAEYRLAPNKKERKTSRSVLARKTASTLLPPSEVEVDSEADTVDPNQQSDEEEGELVDNTGSAAMNVHACVSKEFNDIDLTTPDGRLLTTPLELSDTADLFEAIKTLTAIHFNAAVEQQKSKTIQADINKGHSNISGQSASIKQSESAQKALHFFDDFTRKDKILDLITSASEHVA
jgi:hypothetical protein